MGSVLGVIQRVSFQYCGQFCKVKYFNHYVKRITVFYLAAKIPSTAVEGRAGKASQPSRPTQHTHHTQAHNTQANQSTTPGPPVPDLWHRPEVVGKTSPVDSQCEPCQRKDKQDQVAGDQCSPGSARRGPKTIPPVPFLRVCQCQAG